MKASYLLIAGSLFFLVSCADRTKRKMEGWWKVRKIEVLKNNELKKTIDTGCQYWNFARQSKIEIFDLHTMQNTLHVKFGSNLLRSYDGDGHMQEEFIIGSISDQNLELLTHTKLRQDDYSVIYYFDRIKDTTQGQEKEAF